MPAITLLYIISSLLISIIIGFFQYFFRIKNPPKINILLFCLRTLSVFLLFLLFINPKIKLTETTNIKPKLSVLADNSLSTQFFKEENSVINLINKIKENKNLNSKFETEFYSFGSDIQELDSLSFTARKTNISKAIQSINNLHKNEIGAIVLISDGNQTLGEDYGFINSKQAIYPVVIGDTTRYTDIKISQLNVNKYSYLNNKFPIETFINYEGREKISSVFSIYKNNQKVFSENITLSPEKKSITVSANLISDKKGMHYYSTTVRKLKGEKNIRNNSKKFTVEVLDEETRVLILSSIMHPDLGALKKAIESNKQRKAEIIRINSFKGNLNAYPFVILYQPNRHFQSVFEKRKSNFLLITGFKTNWNFVNSLELGFSKTIIQQSENSDPVYNPDFLTYLQKDIGFAEFPPLKDKFGKINGKEHQTLLFQKLKGVDTSNPLLATFEKGDNKYGVIFGEGVWRWRASSYIREDSFEAFDQFLGNLTQYLTSDKKRKRLDVKLETVYLANENINVSALFLDKNYKFDHRASLQLLVKNTKTNLQKVYPFSLMNNAYQVELEGLESGDYIYKVNVNGQNISKSGKFKVTDFQIEQQFSNANYKKMQLLAEKTGGTLLYKDQTDVLINQLIENKKFVTIQKSNNKEQNLINWTWILYLIVTLLTAEWFLRKYFGKI